MQDLHFPKTVRLTPDHLLQWANQVAESEADAKRTEPRQNLYPEIAELQIRRKKGLPTVTVARSRDLSESGIGLVSRQPIDPDEMVDITFSLDGTSYSARGRIIHCTQAVNGYKIGMMFVF